MPLLALHDDREGEAAAVRRRDGHNREELGVRGDPGDDDLGPLGARRRQVTCLARAPQQLFHVDSTLVAVEQALV
ncbi:hypothetical protein I4F81_009321 [Pyropia yezoensis]|uniref:Uncharacterized protein n=1 Tax=Pyropia yezoensis TaxID=2788 RepID=A0ACC3C942_PYRYE|nr:hypothetical protein I4F81_009321 [Neopyropia yezoensis]